MPRRNRPALTSPTINLELCNQLKKYCEENHYDQYLTEWQGFNSRYRRSSERIFCVMIDYLLNKEPRVHQMLTIDEQCADMETADKQFYNFMLEHCSDQQYVTSPNFYSKYLPEALQMGVRRPGFEGSPGSMNVFVLALVRKHYWFALMLLGAMCHRKDGKNITNCSLARMFLTRNGCTLAYDFVHSSELAPIVILLQKRAKYLHYLLLDALIKVLIRLDIASGENIFPNVKFPCGNNILLFAEGHPRLEEMAQYIFLRYGYSVRLFVNPLTEHAIHNVREPLKAWFRKRWRCLSTRVSTENVFLLVDFPDGICDSSSYNRTTQRHRVFPKVSIKSVFDGTYAQQRIAFDRKYR